MATGQGGTGDLLPHGQNMRRAIEWISMQRRDDPGAKVGKLVEEASLRFDLTPAEAEFLLTTLTAEP